MLKHVLRTVPAASVVGLATVMVVPSGHPALAQVKDRATTVQTARNPLVIEQIVLNDKLIKGMLAASKDVDQITDNAPENINELKPETVAKLDAVTRRCGLASYAEYLSVRDNVYLALDGYDRVTKKYVGHDAVIKAEIARTKADRKLSTSDKQEKITGLNDSLQFQLPPVKYKTNIDLALKYDDLIQSTMRSSD